MQEASTPTTAVPATLWPHDLIDLDRLIGLGEAANLIRRWTGQKTNPATLWRWARSGRSGVLLPHARFGRHVRTTEAALRWFIAETTAAEIGLSNAANGPARHAMTPDVLAEQLKAEGL